MAQKQHFKDDDNATEDGDQLMDCEDDTSQKQLPQLMMSGNGQQNTDNSMNFGNDDNNRQMNTDHNDSSVY